MYAGVSPVSSEKSSLFGQINSEFPPRVDSEEVSSIYLKRFLALRSV